MQPVGIMLGVKYKDTCALKD